MVLDLPTTEGWNAELTYVAWQRPDRESNPRPLDQIRRPNRYATESPVLLQLPVILRIINENIHNFIVSKAFRDRIRGRDLGIAGFFVFKSYTVKLCNWILLIKTWGLFAFFLGHLAPKFQVSDSKSWQVTRMLSQFARN